MNSVGFLVFDRQLPVLRHQRPQDVPKPLLDQPPVRKRPLPSLGRREQCVVELRKVRAIQRLQPPLHKLRVQCSVRQVQVPLPTVTPKESNDTAL